MAQTLFATYLLRAALAWTGLGPALASGDPTGWEKIHFERPDAAKERLAETCENIADAVGGDTAQIRMGLDVLAVAFEESHLARYVDDGTCNLTDPTMKQAHARELAGGDCDGGRSFTVWQFHEGVFDHLRELTGLVVTSEELIGDRGLAAASAWGLRRSNPGAWATWPRAKARADWWWRAHPFAP